MAHPQWALDHKKPGTELRNIGGRYYLYQITSAWDKEEKCTKKITLGMIGVITEKDGLLPKGTVKRGRKPLTRRTITSKEYGASFFLQKIGKDICDALKKHFPYYWEELFIMAVQRVLHQASLKNMEFLFEESFLSEEFKDVQLSKNHLTETLKNIGSNRTPIIQFMKEFITGCEHIVFDTTHTITQSQNMHLARKGYNPEHIFDPQVNLFYIFSVDKQEPTYYRLVPGNIQGMSALKLCLKEAEIQDCIAIGDKGFCSETNLNTLEETRIQYILPLRRDSKLICYNRLNFKNDTCDGYFFYKGRPIFYIGMEQKDGRKVIVFIDKSLALEEEKNYLKRLDEGYEGYSMEKYTSKILTFGTLSMITNCLEFPPQKVYENYKSRMEIETVFDMYKNLLHADRSYMHCDSSMEAWVFINHIATMLYYKVFNLLKTKNYLKTICPLDLLDRLSRVTKLNIKNQWILSEINSKSMKIFSKLNIPVT